MSESKPVKEFRAGVITVAVWDSGYLDHNGQKVGYRCVTLDKRYTDPVSGESRTTRLLGPGDLPKIALLVNKAYEFMISASSE